MVSYKLQMYESKVFRKIFVLRMSVLSGKFRMLQNEELFDTDHLVLLEV